MSFYPKNEQNGTHYVLNIASITLLRMQPAILSPELAVLSTRNMIGESRVSSKKSLDVQKCCASIAKHIALMINRLKFTSLAAKDSNKKTLEECGDGGPMSKYRKALEEAVSVTSNNRGFRTIEHSVATYEQTKKGLSYYYQKK